MTDVIEETPVIPFSFDNESNSEPELVIEQPNPKYCYRNENDVNFHDYSSDTDEEDEKVLTEPKVPFFKRVGFVANSPIHTENYQESMVPIKSIKPDPHSPPPVHKVHLAKRPSPYKNVYINPCDIDISKPNLTIIKNRGRLGSQNNSEINTNKSSCNTIEENKSGELEEEERESEECKYNEIKLQQLQQQQQQQQQQQFFYPSKKLTVTTTHCEEYKYNDDERKIDEADLNRINKILDDEMKMSDFSANSITPNHSSNTTPNVTPSKYNINNKYINTQKDILSTPTTIMPPKHRLSKSDRIPSGDELFQVHNYMSQCCIIRKKSLTSTQYNFFIQLNDDSEVLLMTATKQRCRTPNYHIFDMTRYTGSKLSKKSGNYLGKIRCNFNSTELTIYGRDSFDDDDDSSDKNKKNEDILKPEYGAAKFFDVDFEPDLKGAMPRYIEIVLPSIAVNDRVIPYQPKYKDETLLSLLSDKGVKEGMHELQVKEPAYKNGSYRLNFHGRVNVSSVKNFQLTYKNDVNKVLFQFGKVDDNKFNLDFASPFSPFQAFSIALLQFLY